MTTYQCLNYSTPAPAGLLASPPLAQVNLTLPVTPQQLAASQSAQAAFFDYEGLVVDSEVPLPHTTLDQLRAAFIEARWQDVGGAKIKSLGWYCPLLSANWSPLWQAVYPPQINAAKQLRREGVCEPLDWVAVGAYADAPGTDPENWHNKIIGCLAVAKILEKPAMVFLSPRYQGQGQPVDGALFVKMCAHVRGLIDAELASGAVLWDFGPTPNTPTPWTGDVLSNITWGWKKYLEAA